MLKNWTQHFCVREELTTSFTWEKRAIAKVELYQRLFPESSEAAAWEFVEASGSAEAMAEFQGLLLALEVKSFERREESSDRVAASHGILA